MHLCNGRGSKARDHTAWTDAALAMREMVVAWAAGVLRNAVLTPCAPRASLSPSQVGELSDEACDYRHSRNRRVAPGAPRPRDRGTVGVAVHPRRTQHASHTSAEGGLGAANVAVAWLITVEEYAPRRRCLKLRDSFQLATPCRRVHAAT